MQNPLISNWSRQLAVLTNRKLCCADERKSNRFASTREGEYLIFSILSCSQWWWLKDSQEVWM